MRCATSGQSGTSQLQRNLPSGLRHDTANVGQVLAHVRLQLLRRRIRLQVGITRKPDIPNSLNDGPEMNASVTQIVRIILKMELANPLSPQPADLLHRIESSLRRVTHVV